MDEKRVSNQKASEKNKKERNNHRAREIKSDKFKRVQSPSSINTYNQCPRKYYYNYIEELETFPSIHLIRGKLTHSVLEDFFKVDITKVSESNFMFELRIVLMELFKKHWNENADEINDLDLTQNEINFYHEETKEMVISWFKRFIHNIADDMNKVGLINAFKKHTPKTEEEFISEEHGVRGFIDAIYEYEKDVSNPSGKSDANILGNIHSRCEKEVYLIDYKTSKKAVITTEYRLQLAIYALLYQEKYGFLPKKAGLDFLKFDSAPLYLDVDKELVEMAKREVAKIHENTKTTDKKQYRKNITSLCKWHSGQCDFYDVCKDDE
ncbi:PD-(D/E)XK nuclease family protein [Candidatus Woesearchaeota archaeon]|nr:PD-(D/E)XK nuclease family protein [Candidatus Woesearchaeota archaeon]